MLAAFPGAEAMEGMHEGRHRGDGGDEATVGLGVLSAGVGCGGGEDNFWLRGFGLKVLGLRV